MLQVLVAEGFNTTPEILPCLSPFRTAHVNRFRKYDLDENRPRIEIDYSDKLTYPTVNLYHCHESKFPIAFFARIVAIPLIHYRKSVYE